MLIAYPALRAGSRQQHVVQTELSATLAQSATPAAAAQRQLLWLLESTEVAKWIVQPYTGHALLARI